jgi:uncharacterized repeat protein (TIGR04052 family)
MPHSVEIFMKSVHSRLVFLSLAAVLAACGKSESRPPESQASAQAVTLRFKAMVSGQAFSCNQLYANVGVNTDSAKREFRGKDLRFYVHDVRLVDGSGQDVAVTLKDDGRWQNGGVALLDFEDGTGTCQNGNEPMNSSLVGEIAPGTYRGLKFTVGVPFEKNHLLADNQLSPLNLSAMFWSWTGGYRFMRIEGTDAAGKALAGGLLHLGSTGCTPNDPSDLRKGVASCAAPNRLEVSLASFDPELNTVVLDIGTLFKDTDLAFNTAGSSGGCMSAPDDPECAPMFAKLGLPLGSSPAGQQSLFTME